MKTGINNKINGIDLSFITADWRKNLLKHGIQGRKQCKNGFDWWQA